MRRLRSMLLPLLLLTLAGCADRHNATEEPPVAAEGAADLSSSKAERSKEERSAVHERTNLMKSPPRAMRSQLEAEPAAAPAAPPPAPAAGALPSGEIGSVSGDAPVERKSAPAKPDRLSELGYVDGGSREKGQAAGNLAMPSAGEMPSGLEFRRRAPSSAEAGRGVLDFASGQGLGGSPVTSSRPITAPPPPAPTADKNAWYQNTYQAGEGSRESLEKAIREGVLVDGKRIKLEAFTSAFKQDLPFPTDGALGLSLRTDRSRALPEGGQLFLEVGLQAMAREAGTRPPLNVVLVIDRSGSMSEEGKFEAVKAAATEVINRLTPQDRLGIVSYSYQAALEIPIAPVKSRKPFLEAVQAMSPKGGTNIYDGLNLGFEELKPVARQLDGNLLILLTDGQVTAGERATARFESLAKEASDHNIEVTTIGMGVTYNEALMMSVSRAGGGNYHFIKDAADVGQVIRGELEDLTKAVARGVRLRVVLPEGIELVRILGSEQLSETQAAAVKAEERKIDQKIYEELGIKKDRADQDEPGIKMLIPSFRANDSHVVLLELRVPPGMKVPPGTGRRPLAEVYLKYKDMARRKNAEIDKRLELQYAKDRADSVASIQPAVKKNILGFQTGETLMAVSRFVARRDTPAAVKRLDDQMVLLGVAAREWKDPDLERDATMLGRYKEVLTAFHRRGMNEELAAYLGKSFSYSAYQRLK